MIKLEEDEKIILEERKHWFILLAETFFLVLLAILPFALFVFHWSKVPINLSLILILISIWLLFLWIAFFVIWTDYYLDVFILTNKRIVKTEQNGFFNREASTLSLDKIQDVTMDVRGIIMTFLNIGNISIQTASESPEFIIKGLGNPEKIKEMIMNEYGKYKKT
ncbi:MAG: PH domain-containing protein [Patescibacteria group bacterium]